MSQTYQVEAELTEEEMSLLSNLLFPVSEPTSQEYLELRYKTRPLWRKLIAPAEVRYERSFDDAPEEGA